MLGLLAGALFILALIALYAFMDTYVQDWRRQRRMPQELARRLQYEAKLRDEGAARMARFERRMSQGWDEIMANREAKIDELEARRRSKARKSA